MEFIDSLFNHPWYWLSTGAILMGLELVAAGAYLLWIGLGAVVTGLAVLLFPSLALSLQIIILIVAMVGSVLLGIRVQAKRGNDAAASLNLGLEQFVGRRVVAVTNFENGRGRIKVEDTTYNALCTEAVAVGDTLTVIAVEHGVFHVSSHA